MVRCHKKVTLGVVIQYNLDIKIRQNELNKNLRRHLYQDTRERES